MNRILKGALFAIIVAISACSEGGSISRTGTTTIDKSFLADSIVWGGGKAHAVLFFRARENAGQTEVCGAIMTFGTGLYQSGEIQVLQGNYLRIKGETVANSLVYFSRLPRAGGKPVIDKALGKTANCALTGAAWKPEYKGAPVTMILRATSARL